MSSDTVRRIINALEPELLPTPEPTLRAPLCLARGQRGVLESIEASTVRLYDAELVSLEPASEPRIVVLYSRYSPQDIVLDRLMAEWRVALFTVDGKLIARETFVTRIPYVASWDTIDAFLGREGARLMANVTYGLDCGGRKRDQRFVASLELGATPPCVKLVAVEHSGHL